MSRSSSSYSVQHGSSADSRYHPYSFSPRRPLLPNNQWQQLDAGTAYSSGCSRASSHALGLQLGSSASNPPPSSAVDTRSASRLNSDHGSWNNDRQDFDDMENYLASRPATPLEVVSASEVERLAGHYRVDVTRLHEFNEMSLPRKLLEIYSRQLLQDAANKENCKILTALDSRISKVDARIVESYKPPATVVKALRETIRHYLYQPLTSYRAVHTAAINFYKSRPEDNHPLAKCGYVTDPNVKQIIHKHLEKYAGQERSHVRVLVWRMVTQRTALSKWAKHMDDHFQSGKRDDGLIKQQMARLALMREVAEPLVGIQSVRGQDTNFWVRLDEQVSVLYDKLGPQVTSDSWKGWADGIIARDQLRYKEDITEEIMNPSFNDEHYAAGTQWQYD